MEKWEELLKNPEISHFINTHQGAASRIMTASQKLAENTDALEALMKLLPALDQQVVNVFFSYKTEDEAAARAIVDLMEENAAGKLNITYQARFTEEIVGQSWRQEIRNAVDKANWFILLMPDPSNELDWPLYEVGLFEGQRTSADRLICLYRDDVPSQIEGYQGVQVTDTDEVSKFLQMVFLNENPVPGMKPLNPRMAGKIRELSQQFVRAVSPLKQSINHKVFEPWIKLRVRDLARLQTRDDLDQAEILSANDKVLELFDFMDAPVTWGALRSTIAEAAGDGRWREELFQVIRLIATKRRFDPIQAVFQAHDGKMYRPVVHAIDHRGEREGLIEFFHITFSEEVGAFDPSVMPKSIFVLVTTLRFAFRFRWEVLEKFSRRPFAEGDVEHLACALKRIETDWYSRGMTDQSALESSFTQEDGRRLARMRAEWRKLRNEQRTGELDLAIEKKELEKIPDLLAGVIPMNQEFFEMAINRFAELTRDLGQDHAESNHASRYLATVLEDGRLAAHSG
jgi:hypothetical protein